MNASHVPSDADRRALGALDPAATSRGVAPRTLHRPVGRPGRAFSVYTAQAGYALQTELDFLSNRAIESNIFFSARFLAPAMPRLDDRDVRLAILRDESEGRSRLRFLMPFRVERPGFGIGPSILRSWANPYAPLGVPLLDREDAGETIDNLLEALADPATGLPGILVMPEIRLTGAFGQTARAVALARNLPLTVADEAMRPMLNSREDGQTYLRRVVSAGHLRELKRQGARLKEKGRLAHHVARQPAEVRQRMEEFLTLEASGWKGQSRSALLSDRLRAAFAREAVSNLAEADAVRIHTLDLNGTAIASMIVFLMGGDAYTWKTAYNEAYARFSPGKLLVAALTGWHLDDPNIERTDSCAVPDHPIMSRFWAEREPMGTLIIGLSPNRDRDVRQVATQLHLYRNTRNIAKLLRERIRALARS
ncbi:GNAT family N-acetyltransferase [Xaviernesmea oryzae]|uniref:GNAT family N-acetyltransferase n=1 Tax=Xaviernesmea oryzae TaxID=464029 RepID=A0A1Q9B291_9HYPH|nr:GNAT family N-acetyltransferase [Xaviernesmea oryzae]SEL89135.1 Acetyltransferase (GNAT) domain-containing protein [Xaviernesmea oryzae]